MNEQIKETLNSFARASFLKQRDGFYLEESFQ